MDPRTSPFERFWLAVLSFGIVVNIAQFPQIEESAGPYYGAIPEYSSAEAPAILTEHMRGVNQTFGLPYQLARRFNEPQLTISPSMNISTTNQMAVGFSALRVATYDADVDEATGQFLEDHLVMSGTDRFLGEYGVAIEKAGVPQSVDHFIAVYYEDRLLFAEDSLLPSDLLQDVNDS